MSDAGAPGDRIVLSGLRFEGRHGATDDEREWPQLIELDVELWLDLSLAGRSDELTATVDYGPVIELCRDIVERRSFRLLEAIAEAVAAAVLGATASQTVVVRVRKPAVPIDAELDFAGVEIRRHRH
ncbi:MAG: dihydroneopterin aldolase [Chloroflexota bacterium]|nr:dihydroneopterin aldolase [Chloroflexota bacterium]